MLAFSYSAPPVLHLVFGVVRHELVGNTTDAFRQTWHLPVGENRLTYREFVTLASDVFNRDGKYTLIPKLALTAAGLSSSQARELRELLPRCEHDNRFDSAKFTTRFPTFKITTYREGLNIIG
ncbi:MULTISPECIES: hypothetical protein [Microbacterium]|uniref:Uncharacterized protein n=1 Tax=Microbacterium profundi TaxID=450380 RepID=A0ABV3LK00_9MICO|nr:MULTISPECIES: hypothetical protein [Microbacterium]MCE7481301.1 hypothetical protein [Microbacterium profundi]